jgi:hypothetical protein
MPVSAWVGFVFLILCNSFFLWRFLANKIVRLGPISYSARESPIYFWFFVSVFGASQVFLVIFFSMIIRAQIS